MAHAAVMQLIGNLRQVKLVIEQELLDFFNFLRDKVLLYGNASYLRKYIGQVSVIVIQFFTEVFRMFYFGQFVRIMDKLYDGDFNFFDEDAFPVVQQLQS